MLDERDPLISTVWRLAGFESLQKKHADCVTDFDTLDVFSGLQNASDGFVPVDQT